MATINFDVLDAAFNDRLIPKRLTPNEMHYLNNSVLTANEVYWTIAEDEGLDFEQLESRLRLSKNTLKMYTRWMLDKRIIYAELEGSGGKYIFYLEHTTARGRR